MQFRSWITIFGAVAAVCGLPSNDGFAQSFFDKLFEADVSERRAVPSLRSLNRSGLYRAYRSVSPVPPQQHYGGRYRTVCVRLCDGYYWPVSSSVSRGKFYRDSNTCQSSCDAETELFYLPRFSVDIAGMTDISGRTYERLPRAYSYRKSLVEGCRCKPEPWTVAARARHEFYALEAEERKRMAAQMEERRRDGETDTGEIVREPLETAEQIYAFQSRSYAPSRRVRQTRTRARVPRARYGQRARVPARRRTVSGQSARRGILGW
jgi:Protein of unknown function (DUF2865)